MSDAAILRLSGILAGAIASAVLMPAGAGLGAYMYSPDIHQFFFGFDAQNFSARTIIGLFVFWPLGILGAVMTIAVFAKSVFRPPKLFPMASTLWLPLVYVAGILTGLASTVVTGRGPDFSL
jgi:hypothetical protein